MAFFSNISESFATSDLPVAKYGPPPVPLYGMQPTPTETGWQIFVWFLPYIVIITIVSLAVGLYLNYRKKKNVKRSAKKR